MKHLSTIIIVVFLSLAVICAPDMYADTHDDMPDMYDDIHDALEMDCCFNNYTDEDVANTAIFTSPTGTSFLPSNNLVSPNTHYSNLSSTPPPLKTPIDLLTGTTIKRE